MFRKQLLSWSHYRTLLLWQKLIPCIGRTLSSSCMSTGSSSAWKHEISKSSEKNYRKWYRPKCWRICAERTKSSFGDAPLNVFDRKAKRIQKDWSASLEDGSVYDYVKEEIGNRLADRIYDITRTFEVGVELGCGRGHVSKHLTNEHIETLYQCDGSTNMLNISSVSETISTIKMLVDEEHLPFAENSVGVFLSSLHFHWINDLPGVFQQIYTALKPDGVLIASMFGGDTLFELRSSLQLAETERKGGFSPHISPFTMIRDIGDLLNRAGYAMLTIDVDELRVSYPTVFELLWDLRGMGESNAAWNRKLHLGRDSLISAAAIYQRMYGNEDGTIPATFQVIYLIGWKPHKSQAKPAKRGSGTFSLKDLGSLNKNI